MMFTSIAVCTSLGYVQIFGGNDPGQAVVKSAPGPYALGCTRTHHQVTADLSR
jgi:hypothetical protein